MNMRVQLGCDTHCCRICIVVQVLVRVCGGTHCAALPSIRTQGGKLEGAAEGM